MPETLTIYDRLIGLPLFQGMSSSGIQVTGTEIYECSSGGAWFYRCTNVSLDGCNIHDIDGQELYADYFCYNIQADGKSILDDAS